MLLSSTVGLFVLKVLIHVPLVVPVVRALVVVPMACLPPIGMRTRDNCAIILFQYTVLSKIYVAHEPPQNSNHEPLSFIQYVEYDIRYE